ncbi:MAG TPA: tripartite tricarboxylate transporter substrate binding protein [Xanthobacteraceae bacterium]|nr:tripartite tricarboxylate transporter substrate binding protein [Xanthobacteraceae bacterium]
MTRRQATRGLALIATGLAARGARAQAKYPTHPVRVILPFGAGGVADVTARLVAEGLGQKLGQNFVIENNPGAGGITAARAALTGGKDGYTLTLLTNGTAISVALFNHLPFDPLKDFVPISTIGYFTCVFAVEASSPYHSLSDFLKAVREKPGTINVGTINVGSTQNLTAELFKSTADANFLIVPFRSSPDVVIGLLRNDVQMDMDFYAAVKPTLDSGKARAIATTGAKRSPELPNVATVAEQGVAGFDVTAWNGLYAPAGTPQPILDTLNAALKEVLADPALKKRALALGIDARASTPAELDARMRSDIAKWGTVIARAHIPKE